MSLCRNKYGAAGVIVLIVSIINFCGECVIFHKKRLTVSTSEFLLSENRPCENLTENDRKP